MTGADVGPADDVYALGLLMLECLTGRPEFTGTDIEMALARLSRDPDVDCLPRPWRDAPAAMTARDPGDRPDAAECAVVLERCGQASDERATESIALAARPTTRSRGRGCPTGRVSVADTTHGWCPPPRR